MKLADYGIAYLGKKAKELGFVRDTFEKVVRLTDILEYFNTNPMLRVSLALKGGTAINLTVFDLPRLSVDLDLDYLKVGSRDEMLQMREELNGVIDRYMRSQGYVKTDKTKTPHSLDSWAYAYTNAGGNRDQIKLEINYLLRAHILPAVERAIVSEHFAGAFTVRTLDPIEIYGSKINALLNRAAARDLYDTASMIAAGLFDAHEEAMLRKCVVFYGAISSKTVNKTFEPDAMNRITRHVIKTELLPVLRRNDDFDLESAKTTVREYLQRLLVLTEEEKEFLVRFENGVYLPELLFDDPDLLQRIKHHPMALWKTMPR